MPVQDLTPQLRTRLSRVERAVGVFVVLATLLLLGGFAFYLYSTAQRKGWLKEKFVYHVYVATGAGLRENNEVTLMGFPAGRITQVEAMDPFYWEGNVFVKFEILEPYQDYIWDDSKVKVVPKGFLGERGLEIQLGGVTPGYKPHPTYDVVKDDKKKVSKVNGVWDDQTGAYVPVSKKPNGYGLKTDEAPALTERAEKLVAQVEAALPSFLNLTNEIQKLLVNLNEVASRAEVAVDNVQPILTNAAAITANLKDPDGSLGRWIISPELNMQLTQTLASANQAIAQAKITVANTDTNVTKLATGLDETLINLANLTSNLNAQVQLNTNMVSNIDKLIIDADTMVQGLKHHWLLRSAFKEKKPAPEKKRK
jgi:ABC-type transporter Mla subunit MlaD